MLGLVTGGLLFVGGARVSHLSMLALSAVPIGLVLVLTSSYRRQRLMAFLEPWRDASDTGFQITQSFLAFGSGGLFGVGLGEGKQKLFFLPEAHTDFVLALVGEELGFVGTGMIVLFFVLFVIRGFQISFRATDSVWPLPGNRYHDTDRYSGADQCLCRDGVVADQGAHVAVRQLWWIFLGHQSDRCRDFAQHLSGSAGWTRRGQTAERAWLGEPTMTIVIAAGGTGGHLYPAVALAREFLRRDPSTNILFVGTMRGVESRVLAHEGIRVGDDYRQAGDGKGVAGCHTWSAFCAYWDLAITETSEAAAG